MTNASRSPSPASKRQKTQDEHGESSRPQDHAHKQDKNFTQKEDGTIDDYPHLLPYENKDPNFKPKYHAECHCGAVKYEVSDEPVSSVCCHCTTCQVVHGAVAQRAVLFKKEMVRFNEDSYDAMAFYQTHDKKTGRHLPCKVRCKNCASYIADEGRNMFLAFPSLFKFDDREDRQEPANWKPTDHIFYGQRSLDFERKDGVTFWEGAKDKSDKM
ncbi:hypothetical protein JCM10212_006974 [Sporobolomyces blumeae]